MTKNLVISLRCEKEGGAKTPYLVPSTEMMVSLRQEVSPPAVARTKEEDKEEEAVDFPPCSPWLDDG